MDMIMTLLIAISGCVAIMTIMVSFAGMMIS